MFRFVVRRLVLATALVCVVVVLVFFALRVVPGDPARLVAGEGAGEQEVRAVRGAMGLDDPLPVQLVRFLAGVVAGDLGTSLRSGRAVREEIARAFPVSLSLVASGMFLSGAVGVTGGMLAAVVAGSRSDRLLTGAAAVAASVPAFLTGTLLLVWFAGKLRWFPAGGFQSVWHLALPVATLVVSEGAVILRVARGAAVEVVCSEYVRTAVAKGLGSVRVLSRHVLPNVLVPVLALWVADFGRLLGGAVVIESLFALPGMGYLAVEAVRYRDYPLLQGVVLTLCASSVMAGAVGDLVAGLVDPRLQRGDG